VPPLKGLYFTVWISRLTIEWNVHPDPFIWKTAMFSKIYSTISVQSSSKLLDSKTIAVLDWKFRTSTIELPSVGETFSILAFRTSLTFVWLWNFSKAFCFTTIKNVLGPKVWFVALIVCSSTNPFKAELLLSSNFNCFGNKLITFFLKAF